VAVALRLGLSDEQIRAGVARTVAFEHRMQARHLGGAWILDDTYNGNIEGMRAGLELLKTLPGNRKIYVTPGLVDQGTETEAVHQELGRLIANAKPDRVVLMQNSATKYIQTGLDAGNYDGEVSIETNPLEYYTNLEHFLANGDAVMLQNDWPDSYR
jgi:UDP-N-acetylmuramoyl-tripeptide--D-alanyl-D-alanine ligase